MLSTRVRVLLVDDTPLFAHGLASLLAEDESIEVVGIARDGAEGIAAAERLKPDVVLMDVNMPVQGGISATAALTSRLPSARVILLTGLAAGDWVYDPRLVGAYSCLSKSSRVEEIVATVLAAAGRAVAPHLVDQRVRVGGGRTAIVVDLLTPRELEILRLLGQGQRSVHIAMQLRLQHKTVENYITTIYEKLGVHGRSEAVVQAARNGLLDDLA